MNFRKHQLCQKYHLQTFPSKELIAYLSNFESSSSDLLRVKCLSSCLADASDHVTDLSYQRSISDGCEELPEKELGWGNIGEGQGKHSVVVMGWSWQWCLSPLLLDYYSLLQSIWSFTASLLESNVIRHFK